MDFYYSCYQKELKNILQEYKKEHLSIMPTTFIDQGEDTLFSSQLLRDIGKVFPPQSYLSKSWLLHQKFVHKLTPNENKFIYRAIRFFDKNKEKYNQVQQNPTFENIRTFGLANCGELADACILEQDKENPIIPALKEVSFLRASIQIHIPTDKLVAKGIISADNQMPKKIPLDHVFLICEQGADKSTSEMIKNFKSATREAEALDLWQRRSGKAHQLIINYMKSAGVSMAQLRLLNPKTGEKRYFNLTCNDGKLLIIPADNNIKAFSNDNR